MAKVARLGSIARMCCLLLRKALKQDVLKDDEETGRILLILRKKKHNTAFFVYAHIYCNEPILSKSQQVKGKIELSDYLRKLKAVYTAASDESVNQTDALLKSCLKSESDVRESHTDYQFYLLSSTSEPGGNRNSGQLDEQVSIKLDINGKKIKNNLYSEDEKAGLPDKAAA